MQKDLQFYRFVNYLSKRYLNIFLAIVFVLTAARYLTYVSLQPDSWRTGEWLIHREEGINRRFLIGEVAINLSSWFSVNIELIIIIIQIFLLGCYFVLFEQYLSALNLSKKINSIILTSPILIMFQFNSIFGGLRKEIIGLMIIYLISNPRRRMNGLFNCVNISLLLYCILVYSWEAGILFGPFLIMQIWKMSEIKVIYKYTSICLVISFSLHSFVASLIPVSQRSIDMACARIQTLGAREGVCDSGAYQALAWSVADIQHFIALSWKLYKFENTLLILLGIGIFGLALMYSDKNRGIYVITVLPVTFLFFLGLDYGRWLMIFTSLTFVSVMNSRALRNKMNYVVRKPYYSLLLCINIIIGIPHIAGGGSFLSNSTLQRLYLGVENIWRLVQ